jgi:hypothetical protein
MAFQVSPGVQVSEIDLSNVVPAVSSTRGAFAGMFQWGPVDEVKTVSDGQQLVDEFYKPADSDAGAEDFYSAESFLRYGSSLDIVRLHTTGCYSANASGNSSTILKNSDSYVNDFKDGSEAGTVGSWISRFPGALGNSLKVSVCASSNAYFNDNASAVNLEAGYSAGDTAVIVDDATAFGVGDLIKFSGHDAFYKISAINNSSKTLTFAVVNEVSAGLQVAVADNVQIDRYWEHYALFDKAPGSSAGAVAAGATNDEIHVVVIDEDGEFTGTEGKVLETYGFVSLASDAKDSSGNNNYYKNVIERNSNYIYWSGHETTMLSSVAENRTLATASGTPFSRPALPVHTSLSGGASGRSPVASDKVSTLEEFFQDGETSDISFILIGSTRVDDGSGADEVNTGNLRTAHNTIVNGAIALAEARKDCIVVASPMRESVVGQTSESTQKTNVIDDFASVTSSSYAVLDSGWIYQYDRYNDKYCWIPGNGHTAGIMARSDLLRDPWFSPAGFSRGQYLGITKLAFNPKQASRDDLYRARINPIVTFPGQGTVLFGDKTALSSPSAFDRINVRRLFIVLEKAIATAAKAQLFEFNDAFTRAQFRASVEPFLRDVKNRRGLVDFSVVCDETNNTDTVIDRNEFVCSIFVKPAKSINFITLNFVAARSGVEFEEIYGAV